MTTTPDSKTDLMFTVDGMVKMAKLLGPTDSTEEQIRRDFTAYAYLAGAEIYNRSTKDGLTFDEWQQLKRAFNRARMIINEHDRDR